MEIEITIEEIIKLMKALVGKEEQRTPATKQASKEPYKHSGGQVTATLVTGSSDTTKRSPWSQAERAWLFAQVKPSKGNNHHSDELKRRFGVKRTDKSISACWWRFHNKN